MEVAFKKILQTASVAVCVFLSFSPGSRSEGAPTPTPSPMSSPYMTLEQLEVQLRAQASPYFKSLKKAVEAIEAEKFGEALYALRKAKGNEQYQDYYHYLAGISELGLLKNHLANKRSDSAVAAGERALNHFKTITNGQPYSALLKRVTVLQGETEVELGEAYGRKKSKKRAMENFENGFLRLQKNKLLVLIPQKNIITYAMLCDQKPNDLCNTWVDQLASYLDKGDDIKAVQRVLALRTQIKTPKRETSKSYKVAMDWEKFQEGYFKYLAGNYNEAYETWYDLLKAYPQTDIKLRTKFWMGRAAQKTDHPRQAETLYKEIIKEAPYAYYALLASWFGGIDLLRMISTDVPIVTNRPEKVAPEDLVRVKRAEEFIANGLPSLARLELKEINISETMPNEFLVYLTYLNHQARAHLSVTKIYYELTARGYEGLFSLFGERVMFPTTYYDLVKKHAKYFDLDPIIALSIIKQESAFEPDIVSFANAYGLMQIIKPTAKEMDPKVTVPDLLKPDKNINLGVKYISLMAKRFEGNLIHAFAAYNAGPHNADRWKKTISPSLPPEEYIELITYKETRGYVQNVLRNRYWYSRLINKEVISNLSDLVQLKR